MLYCVCKPRVPTNSDLVVTVCSHSSPSWPEASLERTCHTLHNHKDCMEEIAGRADDTCLDWRLRCLNSVLWATGSWT